MSKRGVVFLLIIIAALVSSIVFMTNRLSYKDVYIDIKQPGVSIDISKSSGGDVISVSSSEAVKLKPGSYMYTPKGDGTDNSTETFEVKESFTLKIDPPYSSDKLNSILLESKDDIRKVITNKYPFVLQDYIISDEALYNRGEWYTAKIIQKVSGGNEPDIYRTIAHKDGSTWSISVKPTLSIDIESNKEVPSYAIRQVNLPLSNSAYSLLYP